MPPDMIADAWRLSTDPGPEQIQAEEPVPEPLFITGIWRSGTSLLYTLMNQNPRIALLYEGDLPVLGPFFFGRALKSRWLERWNFWNRAVERHRIDTATIPSKVLGLRAGVEAAYRAYAMQKGARVWGCKSPSYYAHLTRLAKLFPNARFIVIWRNPVSVCRSITLAGRTEPWFRRTGIEMRALLGARLLKKQCDKLIERGARLHQLQYEHLTHDTETEMRRICGFLGIPFDVRMTSLKQADTSAIYEGTHHSLVKSVNIVSKGPETETLPPESKAKIHRYITLWREQSNGRWPQHPVGGAPMGPPGFVERIKDWAQFRFYLAFDSIVVMIYAFAPLRLLSLHRARKIHAQTD